jgi:hypothetical protein
MHLTGAHRPSILNDDKYSKLIKAIVSSFPNDPPEKDKVSSEIWQRAVLILLLVLDSWV